MRGILENIDTGGFTPCCGGENILSKGILEYIDVGGYRRVKYI